MWFYGARVKCKVSGNGERWAGVVSSANVEAGRDQIFGLEHKRTGEPLRVESSRARAVQGDVLGLNEQEVHTNSPAKTYTMLRYVTGFMFNACNSLMM